MTFADIYRSINESATVFGLFLLIGLGVWVIAISQLNKVSKNKQK